MDREKTDVWGTVDVAPSCDLLSVRFPFLSAEAPSPLLVQVSEVEEESCK